MVRKAGVEFDEGPPDFDPNNPYADPVAMLEYREYLVREKWIAIETAKIIREKLKWCYRIEGTIAPKTYTDLSLRSRTDSAAWGRRCRRPGTSRTPTAVRRTGGVARL
ncbi:hypothetical protein AAC387_Pa10g1452 [Persea americana]